MADVNYFLTITCKNAGQINGEAKASNFADQIQIESWSYGEVNSSSPTSVGGQGAGQVSMQDMHFTSVMCKASTSLMQACATGDHVDSATLSCVKSGADGTPFLVIKLEDGFITSYQSGGSSGSIIPVDQYSIAFSKITADYSTQDPDSGQVSTAGHAGYDLRAQTAV